MITTPFAIGDKVALRASFLRAMGDYTYATASQRGNVVERVLDLPNGHCLVRVQWQGDMWTTVNTVNLIHADRIHLESN